MASGESTSPVKSLRDADGLSGIAHGQDQRFTHGIEGKVIGPMPVNLFLETFLPDQRRTPLPNDVKFSKVPSNPSKESDIYLPLRDDLNKVLEGSNSTLAFYDTSNRAESPGKVGSSKPDLFMLRKNGTNTEGDFCTARMSGVYTFVEVKTSVMDPFTDPPDGITPSGYHKWARSMALALGQSAHYAHIVQTCQFRTCVYSVSITGTVACLLRWDRSGVIVTRPFDYKINPEFLVGFVWRFSRVTDKQRGFDCSAVAVDSEEERKQFADVIRIHAKEQLLGMSTKGIEDEISRHYWPGAITRLTVGTGKEAYKILVSRPMFTSKGVTGRSTRGYWGVECGSQEVVFVKDVWRTEVPEVEAEGAILKGLLAAGVRNIPGFVCHGDVLHKGSIQVTRTDRFAEEKWVEGLDSHRNLIPRNHYRLVTRNAGFSLSTFKGTKELLNATLGVFNAVVDAHSLAKTIHWDLSPRNIILYREPNEPLRAGYLIDWELSRAADRAAAVKHALVGTPGFMSIATSDPKSCDPHGMKDDLESLLYVVLYCALRWLPVHSPGRGLDWWLNDFFSPPNRDGAHLKLYNAMTRNFTRDLTSMQIQAILDWLNAAMDLHYHPSGGPNPVGPNPAWDDGRALEAMWKETLTKDLPDDDWQENPIPNIAVREAHFLHTTYTAGTTSATAYKPHSTLLQQPLAIAAHRTSSKRPGSTPSSAGDVSGLLSLRDSKRRRYGLDQEGEEVPHNPTPFLEVSMIGRDSPDILSARKSELQRMGSPPPPMLSSPRSRPSSTTGRITRSSTRRMANETRAAPTSGPTVTSRVGKNIAK